MKANAKDEMVVDSEGLFYIDENQLALKGILQIVKIKYAQTSMIIAWEMHYQPALQFMYWFKRCVTRDEFVRNLEGRKRRGH